MNDRAQSETIGVVLLVGIAVISVATVGAFALSSIESDTVNTDVSAHVTTDAYYFTHEGGDPIEMSNLRIVIQDGDQTLRPAFGSGSIYDGDADDVFEPGERWVGLGTTFDLQTPVTVALYETRTNSLLVKETLYPDRFFAAGPTPPIPRFSVDPSPAYADDPATFDASDSEAPEGSIVSYTWTFEDGTTKSGETASFTFSSSGTYNVTLSVEDDLGIVNNTTRTVTVLPAAPQVDSVAVSNAPLNDSDVDQTQTVTVTYDRPMDTSTTPTVELTNLSATVTDGTGSWTNNRTFVQEIDVGDANEESIARVNVTGGADTTGSVAAADNSTTVFVDTLTPTISNYAVTNPSGSTIRVEFTSSEQLDAVTVPLTEKNAGLITTFSESAFSVTETGGGEYRYSTNYTAPAKGDYTATLDRAADGVGNDGASGESGTVKIQTGSGKPVIRNFSGIVASSDGDYVEVGNVTVEEFTSGNSEGIDSVTVEVREAGTSTVLGSTTFQGDKQTSRISQEDVRVDGFNVEKGTKYDVTVVANSTSGASTKETKQATGQETQAAGAPTADVNNVVAQKNTGELEFDLNATDDKGLKNVTVVVKDKKDNEEQYQQVGNEQSESLSGTFVDKRVTISFPDVEFKKGTDYQIEIRVYDTDGNSTPLIEKDAPVQ